MVSSPLASLIGGGIAMCCLYERGERLDALGYWILAIMLVPIFVMVFLSLVWRDADETEDDEIDEG